MEFYTYCYLDDNMEPYYVGKGKNDRINQPHGDYITLPPLEKRVYLKSGLSEKDAFKHEVYLINTIGRKDLGLGPLLNRTNGGDGTSGWVMPEETKEKISSSKRGKKRPDMEGLNNPMSRRDVVKKVSDSKVGKPRDLETKSKISNSLTGKKATAETKQKQSDAAKGVKKSKSHADNIKKAKKGTMYFVNIDGMVIVRKTHPGPDWQRGMKWKELGY